MLLSSGVFFCCWFCGASPEWPVDGNVDARWVEEAIEWRMRTGLDCCGESGRAVDALTLEWIANSTDVVIRIESEKWPILRYYEELKTPLIQAMALAQLRSEPLDDVALLSMLRKVVRRSDALKYRRVKTYLRPRQTSSPMQ
ncbi:MAG: hypothetical protein ACO2ZL_05900 [Flavobacteriales bacterium]